MTSSSDPRVRRALGYTPSAFSLTPKVDDTLKAGTVVRDVSGRLYFVAMVNQSRARILPLEAGEPMDISPRAPLPTIDINTLTDNQFRRFDTMAKTRATATATVPAADTTATAQQGAALPIATAADIAAGIDSTDHTTDEDTDMAATKTRLRKLAVKPESTATPLGQTKTKTAKTAKPAVAAKTAGKGAIAKATTTVKKCACGCGDETTGFFVPGHDARFKGWLLKIERGQAQPTDLMPKKVADAYEWKKVNRKVGDETVTGLIPTTNYKGEPHEGYLKADGTKRATRG